MILYPQIRNSMTQLTIIYVVKSVYNQNNIRHYPNKKKVNILRALTWIHVKMYLNDLSLMASRITRGTSFGSPGKYSYKNGHQDSPNFSRYRDLIQSTQSLSFSFMKYTRIKSKFSLKNKNKFIAQERNLILCTNRYVILSVYR